MGFRTNYDDEDCFSDRHSQIWTLSKVFQNGYSVLLGHDCRNESCQVASPPVGENVCQCSMQFCAGVVFEYGAYSCLTILASVPRRDVLEKPLGGIPGLNSMGSGLANNYSWPHCFVSFGPEPLDIGVCFSKPIDGVEGELGQGALSFLINSLITA